MLAIRTTRLLAAFAGIACIQAALGQSQPEPDLTKRPRIGLVLSGGGARGGAHIGVLRVLEEMRVPVDVIAATSAGAIVGGAYASGMPLFDIEAEMKGLNTQVLFRDVHRDDVPFRRKSDDGLNYIGPEMGLGPQGLSLPKGVVAGVAVEGVLRRIARRQTSTNFDQFPIRFRAVATDLASSDMVVLDHGSLSLAMRASMAVPAAVNPVEIDGRLLVDGGLKRNLPVDVARQMGADVIIAVNIATPLQTREQLTSLVSVSDQMLRILIAENESRSLAELKPDTDVLIAPQLGDIVSASFDRLTEAAQRGEEAARAMADKLARYALPETAYREHLAQQRRTAGEEAPVIDEVRVVGLRVADPDVVLAAMDTAAGTRFDPTRMEADLRRIYGRGDFEGVNYALVDEPGTGRVLEVEATEKSWGPNFLRFGVSLSSDFEGNAFFTLRATQRWTWLNALGAEWRNDLLIGHTDRITSEWYQPLNARQTFFVAPRIDLQRVPADVYDDTTGKRLARFRLQYGGVGVDVGQPLGKWGEWRLGVSRGEVSVHDDTTLIPAESIVSSQRVAGLQAQLRVDKLDSLRFPRRGYSLLLQVFQSSPALGASETYRRASMDVSYATASGPHALLVNLRAGGHPGSGPLPFHETFSLGGFLQLSGYKTNQLTGGEMGLGKLVYSYRIGQPGVLDGVYLGGSLEAGRIGDSAFGTNRSALRRGNSLFLALDTPIGPVYLAYGVGDRGNRAAYFFLGEPY